MSPGNGDYSASVTRCLTLHRWTLNCTALTCSIEHGWLSHTASERTYRKHRLHHPFYCCVMSPACVSCGRSTATAVVYSHLLATGLYATIWKKTTLHRTRYNSSQTIWRWKKNQFPKYIFNKLREMDRVQNNSFNQSNIFRHNWQTRPSHHQQMDKKVSSNMPVWLQTRCISYLLYYRCTAML
jgi:hypothetical protein